MGRSKCVMCGKVRDRKFLIEFPNLENGKVWLCDKELGYFKHNYVAIDNIHYNVNKCQLNYLKMLNKIIEEKKNLYLAAKKSLYIYNKINQVKNVSPELTFLLQ